MHTEKLSVIKCVSSHFPPPRVIDDYDDTEDVRPGDGAILYIYGIDPDDLSVSAQIVGW
jgi:hypothetical protein